MNHHDTVVHHDGSVHKVRKPVDIPTNRTFFDGAIPTFTPEEIHSAQISVCAMATDPDDARELLQMLGLL
jgi:hypothetical protein